MGYSQTNPYGYYLTFGSKINDAVITSTPATSTVIGQFTLPANLSGRVISAYADWRFNCIEDTSGAINQVTNTFKAYIYQGATGYEMLRITDVPSFHVHANGQRPGGYLYGNIDIKNYLNFGAEQTVWIEYPVCTADYIIIRESQVVLRLWCI